MPASFRDIKSDVMARIIGGDWPPGTLLPTEADLADEFGAARATVNRALRELAEEGVLDRKRKSGTRVRQAPLRHAKLDITVTRQEVEARGAVYKYALVDSRITTPPDGLRARLSLSPEGKVRRVIAVHYADGIPFQYEDRWINLATLPAAADADFTGSGPNEWLISTIPYTDMELSFSAIAADDAVAEHLDCPAGTALFQMERTTWYDGAAVTFVRMTFQPGYRKSASS